MLKGIYKQTFTSLLDFKKAKAKPYIIARQSQSIPLYVITNERRKMKQSIHKKQKRFYKFIKFYQRKTILAMKVRPRAELLKSVTPIPAPIGLLAKLELYAYSASM